MNEESKYYIYIISFIMSIVLLVVWVFLDIADRMYFNPWIAATRGYREYLFIIGIILSFISMFLRKRR